MLVALLLAVILAASADGTARVPGTRLKLGMTEKQVQAQGTFVESPAADAKGMAARKGELRFFGVLCQATLLFRNGRLTRTHFVADGISPQAIAYVEDQLVRHRMWKECSRYDAEQHSCVWHGELRLHLETRPARLEARVEPAGEVPWESEPVAATKEPETKKEAADAAASAKAAPDSAARPATTAGPRTEAPAKTESATKNDAPAGSATAAAAASGTTPVAAPGSIAGAAPSPTSIAVLPDTFTISLVTRNSPSDWPRIVSSPPLEYPDAARRESVQGIVWVLAQVSPDGSVQSARVQRGIRELNDAAVAWIQQSRFAPCVRDNAPCRFWVRVAVRFTLF
jgi:TonB family protein